MRCQSSYILHLDMPVWLAVSSSENGEYTVTGLPWGVEWFWGTSLSQVLGPKGPVSHLTERQRMGNQGMFCVFTSGFLFGWGVGTEDCKPWLGRKAYEDHWSMGEAAVCLGRLLHWKHPIPKYPWSQLSEAHTIPHPLPFQETSCNGVRWKGK